MTPRHIQLVTALPDTWCVAQRGKLLGHDAYDVLISGEAVDVDKPDGTPLLRFRPAALATATCEAARPALRRAAAVYSDARGLWGGLVGFYERPSCRVTAFTGNNLNDWGAVLPFIRACNQVFRKGVPERYIPQRALAYHTDPDYTIANTAFTTMTVNLWDATHDARTPVHKDKGDLAEGFGVLSVLSTGTYLGGYLIFPKYRVAVDLRTTDVLLADVHEWHANAPIVGLPGWERIACVLYYRAKMATRCPR